MRTHAYHTKDSANVFTSFNVTRGKKYPLLGEGVPRYFSTSSCDTHSAPPGCAPSVQNYEPSSPRTGLDDTRVT